MNGVSATSNIADPVEAAAEAAKAAREAAAKAFAKSLAKAAAEKRIRDNAAAEAAARAASAPPPPLLPPPPLNELQLTPPINDLQLHPQAFETQPVGFNANGTAETRALGDAGLAANPPAETEFKVTINGQQLTYKIVEADRIGQGADGDVFIGKLVYPEGTPAPGPETIIVKRSKANDASAAQANVHESEIFDQLGKQDPSSDNIIKYYGTEKGSDGRVYIFQEAGITAYTDPARSESATPDERLKSANELSDGVEYLHDHDITHNDIGTKNLVYGADGKLKIIDFGGSDDWAAEEDSKLYGIYKGTPGQGGFPLTYADAIKTDNNQSILTTYNILTGEQESILPTDRAKIVEALKAKNFDEVESGRLADVFTSNVDQPNLQFANLKGATNEIAATRLEKNNVGLRSAVDESNNPRSNDPTYKPNLFPGRGGALTSLPIVKNLLDRVNKGEAQYLTKQDWAIIREAYNKLVAVNDQTPKIIGETNPTADQIKTLTDKVNEPNSAGLKRLAKYNEETGQTLPYNEARERIKGFAKDPGLIKSDDDKKLVQAFADKPITGTGDVNNEILTALSNVEQGNLADKQLPISKLPNAPDNLPIDRNHRVSYDAVRNLVGGYADIYSDKLISDTAKGAVRAQILGLLSDISGYGEPALEGKLKLIEDLLKADPPDPKALEKALRDLTVTSANSADNLRYGNSSLNREIGSAYDPNTMSDGTNTPRSDSLVTNLEHRSDALKDLLGQYPDATVKIQFLVDATYAAKRTAFDADGLPKSSSTAVGYDPNAQNREDRVIEEQEAKRQKTDGGLLGGNPPTDVINPDGTTTKTFVNDNATLVQHFDANNQLTDDRLDTSEVVDGKSQIVHSELIDYKVDPHTFTDIDYTYRNGEIDKSYETKLQSGRSLIKDAIPDDPPVEFDSDGSYLQDTEYKYVDGQPVKSKELNISLDAEYVGTFHSSVEYDDSGKVKQTTTLRDTNPKDPNDRTVTDYHPDGNTTETHLKDGIPIEVKEYANNIVTDRTVLATGEIDGTTVIEKSQTYHYGGPQGLTPTLTSETDYQSGNRSATREYTTVHSDGVTYTQTKTFAYVDNEPFLTDTQLSDANNKLHHSIQEHRAGTNPVTDPPYQLETEYYPNEKPQTETKTVNGKVEHQVKYDDSGNKSEETTTTVDANSENRVIRTSETRVFNGGTDTVGSVKSKSEFNADGSPLKTTDYKSSAPQIYETDTYDVTNYKDNQKTSLEHVENNVKRKETVYIAGTENPSSISEFDKNGNPVSEEIFDGTDPVSKTTYNADGSKTHKITNSDHSTLESTTKDGHFAGYVTANDANGNLISQSNYDSAGTRISYTDGASDPNTDTTTFYKSDGHIDHVEVWHIDGRILSDSIYTYRGDGTHYSTTKSNDNNYTTTVEYGSDTSEVKLSESVLKYDFSRTETTYNKDGTTTEEAYSSADDKDITRRTITRLDHTKQTEFIYDTTGFKVTDYDKLGNKPTKVTSFGPEPDYNKLSEVSYGYSDAGHTQTSVPNDGSGNVYTEYYGTDEKIISAQTNRPDHTISAVWTYYPDHFQVDTYDETGNNLIKQEGYATDANGGITLQTRASFEYQPDGSKVTTFDDINRSGYASKVTELKGVKVSTEELTPDSRTEILYREDGTQRIVDTHDSAGVNRVNYAADGITATDGISWSQDGQQTSKTTYVDGVKTHEDAPRAEGEGGGIATDFGSDGKVTHVAITNSTGEEVYGYNTSDNSFSGFPGSDQYRTSDSQEIYRGNSSLNFSDGAQAQSFQDIVNTLRQNATTEFSESLEGNRRLKNFVNFLENVDNEGLPISALQNVDVDHIENITIDTTEAQTWLNKVADLPDDVVPVEKKNAIRRLVKNIQIGARLGKTVNALQNTAWVAANIVFGDGIDAVTYTAKAAEWVKNFSEAKIGGRTAVQTTSRTAVQATKGLDFEAAARLLGPVAFVVLAAVSIGFSIPVFIDAKANGADPAELSYILLSPVGLGGVSAVLDARQKGASPGEQAKAFITGSLGLYDPSKPGGPFRGIRRERIRNRENAIESYTTLQNIHIPANGDDPGFDSSQHVQDALSYEGHPFYDPVVEQALYDYMLTYHSTDDNFVWRVDGGNGEYFTNYFGDQEWGWYEDQRPIYSSEASSITSLDQLNIVGLVGQPEFNTDLVKAEQEPDHETFGTS